MQESQRWLKEQLWRIKRRRKEERFVVERVDMEKRANEEKQICFRGSLTTVEHLVHGEGLQEVGADGVMPDFLLPVVAG